MHTSTKVLKSVMDEEFFATFLELEANGGHWTFEEDCDTFHYEGKPLVLLFDIAPGIPADFECHPAFEEMVWAKRK